MGFGREIGGSTCAEINSVILVNHHAVKSPLAVPSSAVGTCRISVPGVVDHGSLISAAGRLLWLPALSPSKFSGRAYRCAKSRVGKISSSYRRNDR